MLVVFRKVLLPQLQVPLLRVNVGLQAEHVPGVGHCPQFAETRNG
mgnify:CR=1 FL=1